MCGGSLLVVPCSHVCHVYRKNTPYTYPGGTEKVIYRNNKRLINVWTDEYQTYFNKIRLELYNVDAGDVSSRLELKKKLKCKSFKWYLENIYPEAPIPHDFFHIGQVCMIISFLLNINRFELNFQYKHKILISVLKSEFFN